MKSLEYAAKIIIQFYNDSSSDEIFYVDSKEAEKEYYKMISQWKRSTGWWYWRPRFFKYNDYDETSSYCREWDDIRFVKLQKLNN